MSASRAPRVILLHPNDGCLTVARALRRRGVEVVALTDPRHAYVLSSRGVRGRVLPVATDDPAAWLDELNRLAADGGGVVISGSDAATTFLAGYRDQLPASLRSFESSDRTHLDLMDKSALYRIAEEAGVRVPWQRHVRTPAELAAVSGGVVYPCVLKPALGHLAKAATGVGTLHVTGPAQLHRHGVVLLGHGIDFMLTELIPGPETALEGAVTIRRADGSYALEYGRRKLRQWPPDYGTGSLLESCDVPDMLKLNRMLLDHVGFTGLSSCEAKRHAETGELCLIEINVRVPANFGLSRAAGVDGPWRLYAALAGLPLDAQPRQVNGRKVVMHPDLLAALAHVRSGRTSPRQVLTGWRGTRDFGVADVRDPLPALTLARQVLARGVARLRARPGR